MKRRIVLILIIVGILGMIVGGTLWYLKKRNPATVYSHAEVAMRAGKYDKAEKLVDKYIDAHPDDWNGYYLLAEVYTGQGRYEDARIQLEELQAKEQTLKPDMYKLFTLLEKTYGFPAREFLKVAEATTPIDKLQEAIEKMRKGNEILSGIHTEEQHRALEVQDGIARNKAFMSDFLFQIANRYRSEAEIAEAAGENELGETRRTQYSETLQEAKREAHDAIRLYLAVVSQDPSRDTAAENLAKLCVKPGNREFLPAARQAILTAKDANPVAKMELIVDTLKSNEYGLPTPASEILQAARKLDMLLEQYPNQEQILFQRARCAFSLSDFSTVEELLGKLFKNKPRHRDARLLEARMMHARGQTTEAEGKLFSLKGEYRDWIEAHLVFAKVASSAGKEGRARGAMRQVIEMDPTNANALRFLAYSLLREGLFEEAFMDAQSYYNAHPDDPAALELYVQSAIGTGKVSEARRVLDKTKADYASDPVLLYEVAEGYGMIKDKAKQRASFRVVAECTPTGVLDRVCVFRAMLLLGRNAEAEALLLDAIRSSSAHPEFHYLLGQVYEETGDTLQAIEQFRQAVELDSTNDTYRLSLAETYLSIGDVDECKNVLDKVSHTDARANKIRLKIKLIQGEPIYSEEALAQSEGSESVMFAVACLKSGDPNRCIAICTSELARNPEDVHVRDILGRAYLALGRKDQCYEQWKEILKVSPGQLVNYLRLARLLIRDHSVPEVAEKLASISNTRPELIELTKGWLFTYLGKPSSALDVYERLVRRPEVPVVIRSRVRFTMAEILGKQRRWKEAIAVLDGARDGNIYQNRSDVLKAKLLIADQQLPRAEALLEALRADARERRNAAVLRRVAESYMDMKRYDKALTVCDDIEGLFPNDPDTYLLRGSILTILGRQAEAIQSYRRAIQCRPSRLDIYSKFAKTLDNWDQPLEALSVLDELEKFNDTGRLKALLDQGLLFTQWGLYAQAVDCYERLAALPEGDSPKIRLYLGQALAGMGRKDRARQMLKDIPEYSGEYTQAQLLLVLLADETEEKLAILRRLEAAQADPVEILGTRMKVLQDAGRADESVRMFRSFLNDYPQGQPFPAELHHVALGTVLHAKDREASLDLVQEIVRRQELPVWSYIAVLLSADTQPGDAVAMLPEDTNKSGLYDALLGVCLSRQNGDAQAAQLWFDRFKKIDEQFGQRESARPIPSSYKILVYLAMGATSKAKAELEAFRSENIIDRSVAADFIDYVESNAASGRAEAAELLKASVAIDLLALDLGKSWAMELLKNRPKCQWAASLLLASNMDESTLRQVHEILQPKNTVLARTVEAEHLVWTRQFTKAASIYGQLAREGQGRESFLFRQGTALENAGQFAEALQVYQQVWESTRNPIAANNASYLVSELAGGNEIELAKAKLWIDQAVKASPDVWAFRDTRGWICYLQGNYDQACKQLRRVIKELPDSPEVHYHLGMAESAQKNDKLARWHLEAAVQLGHTRQNGSDDLTPSERKAIERAEAALAKIEPGQ